MNKKNITSGEGKKKNAVGNIFTKSLEKKQSAFSLPSINVSAQATIKKLS